MEEDRAREQPLVPVGKRCYVGGLAWRTSWQDLKDAFRPYGNVVYANVMMEDGGQRSKGWGIVEFETPEEALAAINALNGQELDGRSINVREDREDKEIKGPGGFSGGGRSGGSGSVGGHSGGRAPRDEYIRRPSRAGPYDRPSVGSLYDRGFERGFAAAALVAGGYGGGAYGAGAYGIPSYGRDPYPSRGGAVGYERAYFSDRPARDLYSRPHERAPYPSSRDLGRGPPPSRSGESSGLQIVVQGLPFSWTWKELKDMFGDMRAQLDRADVVIGADGRSKGYGIVRFTDTETARRAVLKWNEQDLEGRRLAVFIDKFA